MLDQAAGTDGPDVLVVEAVDGADALARVRGLSDPARLVVGQQAPVTASPDIGGIAATSA